MFKNCSHLRCYGAALGWSSRRFERTCDRHLQGFKVYEEIQKLLMFRVLFHRLVLFCVLFCCLVLFCVLCFLVLFCLPLCCFVLFYVLLCCSALFCVLLCRFVFCCVILFCVPFRFVVLCSVVLCSVVGFPYYEINELFLRRTNLVKRNQHLSNYIKQCAS